MFYNLAEYLSRIPPKYRHAEPILWMVLSNVYSLLKKKYGISKDEIAGLIDEHKKEILKEISLDVDEKLKKLL